MKLSDDSFDVSFENCIRKRAFLCCSQMNHHPVGAYIFNKSKIVPQKNMKIFCVITIYRFDSHPLKQGVLEGPIRE